VTSLTQLSPRRQGPVGALRHALIENVDDRIGVEKEQAALPERNIVVRQRRLLGPAFREEIRGARRAQLFTPCLHVERRRFDRFENHLVAVAADPVMKAPAKW